MQRDCNLDVHCRLAKLLTRRQGRIRYKVMTLATHEFIRRFLMHVLPAGFHRIRYYGLLASGKRAENVARARELLMPPISDAMSA
jgi:Putative transposase